MSSDSLQSDQGQSLKQKQTSPNPESSQKIKLNKQKYEWVWKAIFIFISSVSVILLYKVYLYQTSLSLQSIRKGNIYDLLKYGLSFSIIFIVGEEVTHKYLDRKIQTSFINHELYKSVQKRKQRCFMIVKWGWNVLYYLLSVVWGYWVIKDTEIWPEWLGGQGQCNEIGKYVNDFNEATFSMQALYTIHFGRHFAKLIQHCFIATQGNYYEFALHHGLSTFLIFFSYLTNMWLIGLFVLLIHDFSDIWLIVARVMRDGRVIPKKVLVVVDYVGGVAWFGCRIFLLSYCCIYSGLRLLWDFEQRPELYNQQIVTLIYLPVVFMTFMLTALQIVQLFWTYFIVCAFVGSNISSDLAKHSYD